MQNVSRSPGYIVWNLALEDLESSLWFLRNSAFKRLGFWPLSNANALSVSGTLQHGHYQLVDNNRGGDGRVHVTAQFCWSKAHWLYVCCGITQTVQKAWESDCPCLSVPSPRQPPQHTVALLPERLCFKSIPTVTTSSQSQFKSEIKHQI